MTKKQLLTLVIAVVAFAAYAYYFTDWFTSDRIQIVHTLRPATPAKNPRRQRMADNPLVNTVSFGLNSKYKLTAVKVIPVAELETNKYAHPIWHLVSESNSIPTKGFVYGTYIKGMHPKVPGAQADPLLPDVNYRLLLEAGDIKGEYDFNTTARTGAAK
jgi:hypothetical protein